MIEPGSTIGIFGSGQLGRMLAIEARKMGFRVACFSPASDTPTGQIADVEIVSPYEDLEVVRRFADSVDVVTFEFENIPAHTIEVASNHSKVHPNGDILYITQNRLREKTFLFGSGFPVAPFYQVVTREDLEKAIGKTGYPCVLKTAGFGYDGKGQTKIRSKADIGPALEKGGGRECILESFIDFEKEVSVVCGRDEKGNFENYGVMENDHMNHILDVTFAPAEVPHAVWEEAIEIARGIAEKFGYVGTMCVEFFLTKKKDLLVNEIAPRPHNSGHLTFDAAYTSQFEQQLRAVCGMPLGPTGLLKPAAMANILGDLWSDGEPVWRNALSMGAKLHLYGKSEPRPGRKMGHLTAMADTVGKAVEIVRSARESLIGKLIH
ncbi:MAG: 5-(carboxyamino)imidazole ribonucleotide synthase [Acidobacteriota bacterium]|nr:5-(carboxyamino)imidazole ribonucleotide synthase [Acidobacteriota bacterium]MDH3528154.1 5-(carboxyamino)imidazole ribonucleotide synthase [Acidobacteriota bacterium]